ncbi:MULTISPECIES: SprT family protein [unclassified Granulicatella]|uniref:SprT family protein n=1 Tax=unclassified Granulicatella TaxID=2630493 RepID=UPI001073AA6B|nr:MULTISPECIES: SprT family protein [unclassified Granulicatella]MBF0779503.1 SprT family protein [Granulicatella sp. 19428wC4_WM01]TFU96469.1 SprT family protein [Granulicatella sp. WM01]
MNDEQLQQLVEQISLEWFKRPFLHRAFFNRRLKTTGGRYHIKTHHIDVNKKVLDRFGIDELVGVIKHELCHYHLHLQHKGYRHQDKDFKVLLKQVGGSRYVKNVDDNVLFHVYQCTCCECLVFRKRKIEIKYYRCANCLSALVYVGRHKREDFA